ncbi:MAG: DUF2141 domain-containing protein [Rhodocyclaceae bacterium]
MSYPIRLIALALLLAGGSARAADLVVRFKGVSSGAGVVMAALYDSESAYKAKDALRKMRLPASGPLTAEFKDLPPGKYAITAYHDENGNGALDKASTGEPTEAYGFSRNPSARFGPPPFPDMAVVVDKTNVQIDVVLE